MTSLEHVSVELDVLNPLPSWNGDGVGENEDEVEFEEVGVGVAVTTPDEDEEEGEGEGEEEVHVGVALVGDEQGPSDDDRGGGASVGALRSVALSEVLGSACHSHSHSHFHSHSHSHSHSGSGSNSRSRSQSSVREGMEIEMAESSVATSWTLPEDGVGERPSRDSERRPSGEAHCRTSLDRSMSRSKETTEARREEEEEMEEEEEGNRVPREGTEMVSLLSQPLGGKDRSGDVSRKEEVIVIQEEDIGEGWHPLQYNGKARLQDAEMAEGEKDEEGNGEEDVGFVHALESIRGGSQSLEMSEKAPSRTFGSSGRNTRHLRLEFKRASPQPWEEIDPPSDNNEVYGSDYYSTLNSKKFGTLQNSRRRPLIPHSSYYFGPPPPGSAYGTPPVGQMGVHHPREIVRIERDYTGGELIQFSPVFPLELEGRITPTQFHQTINTINEILISAHSIRHSFVDNFLAVATLQLSTLVMTSHYTKEMRRLKRKIEEQNTQLYNPVGLNILWPQKVAFLFLEIEYY